MDEWLKTLQKLTNINLSAVRRISCGKYKANRKHKKVVRNHMHKFKIEDGDQPIMSNKEILVGASDYRDLYIMKFFDERTKANISTITQKISVRGNSHQAHQFVRTNYKDAFIFSAGNDRYIIRLLDSIIEVDANSNIIDFTFHGTFDEIDRIKVQVLDVFEEISVYINWIYDANMNTATIPVDSTLNPVDEMYPWLGDETLESYYQRYMESSASILILLGAPGTGKTSFIRGLLTSTSSSANVTYDEAILGKDSLFSDFIEGNSNVLVIEDADIFLSARKDGNAMMHRFLNVGDGLVTVKGKKIIFSTNLPSIKDIDDALLRPGRCHDVLHFEELTKAQADKLAKKIGIDYHFEDGKETFSIAEIFSGVRNSQNKQQKNKFGFI